MAGEMNFREQDEAKLLAEFAGWLGPALEMLSIDEAVAAFLAARRAKREAAYK